MSFRPDLEPTLPVQQPSVSITTPTRAALLAEIEGLLTARQGFALATLNLDHLVKLRRQPRSCIRAS